MKKINTTPYHHKCDRKAERFNGTLVKTLSFSNLQKDLDVDINDALFAYRTSINSSRGESPYYMNQHISCYLAENQDCLQTLHSKNSSSYCFRI